MYSCGLRESEAIGLTMRTLDLGKTYVRVVGKGDKERIVPLGERARVALENYLTDAESGASQGLDNGRAIHQPPGQETVSSAALEGIPYPLHPRGDYGRTPANPAAFLCHASVTGRGRPPSDSRATWS